MRQALLDGRFDLPPVGRLPSKEGTVPQRWKAMAVLGAEVWPNIFVGGQLEIFTAALHGDDLFSAPRGQKTAMSPGAMGSEDLGGLDA